MMNKKPHIVVVPFPAQGHVKPLLHLSHRLVDLGIKVTFVNTDIIHAKITADMSLKEIEESKITLASIPDGLETEKDRTDSQKFLATTREVMPEHLLKLIETINNKSNDEPVTCIVADVTIGWILDVAESVRLQRVGFMPMSAACLVLLSNIPKLIQAGIIDNNGTTTITDEQVRVSKEIPPWSSDELPWRFSLDMTIQKAYFETCVTMKEAFEKVDCVLCNTCNELDQSSCNLISKILPIGPLHTNLEAKFCGSFWKEDTSCLNWLRKQKPGSVIYVSLGSLAVMSQPQFNELALGLKQSGKPFLWIVREDIVYGLPPEYPEGFLENLGEYGKIVKWAPQDKVLSHPAIACFLSHCGWNSTLEGLSAGVPFLCWPFFGDQFHNRNFICDAWNVGLKLNSDKTGTITSYEICKRIQVLLSDSYMKENAAKMKIWLQKSISKKGSSFEILENFVNHLKQRQ